MDERKWACFAVAAFGLEGVVAAELRRLKMSEVRAENGGVRFEGTAEDIFLCNLRLRTCDRIYLMMAEGETASFEDLYQMVSSVPWERLCKGTEKYLVTAQCARSRLMSPRDCQSITKKAILERLKKRAGIGFFPENGVDFPVHVQIHSNRTRILLNTSGPSLSRRGYRTWNGEAPLRETLAAALVELSLWKPGIPLYDPCCGTGTLLIEAAMRQGHMAPGRNRAFAMESFSFIPKDRCAQIREQATQESQPERISGIGGSDVDTEAIRLAQLHLRQAELGGRIPLKTLPLQELQLEEKNGVFLCNPPYGERMSDVASCRKLYRELSLMMKRHPAWSLCAISSDPGFEKAFGRRADKTRRLYNGRLECQFYIFSS